MGIELSIVKENRWLDRGIIDSLAGTYDNFMCECGTELHTDDTLSEIYCPNKKCFNNIGMRIYKMMRLMNVSNWDLDTSIKTAKAFMLSSPYQVFILADKEVDCIKNLNSRVLGLIMSKNRDAYLWEVVKYGNFRTVSDIAESLFKNYSNIQEYYKDLEMYGVPFVADRLGLYGDYSVVAATVYKKLIDIKEELIFGVGHFYIKEEKKTLNVALDGIPYNFKSKEEFIGSLNSKISNVSIKLNKIVNGATQIVIVIDKDDTYKSAKLIQDMAINNNPNSIPGIDTILICNIDEFKEYMRLSYGLR